MANIRLRMSMLFKKKKDEYKLWKQMGLLLVK